MAMGATTVAALLQELMSLRGAGKHASQQALTDSLVQDGCLKTPKVIRAFAAVDRRHFLSEDTKQTAYMDSPMRDGNLHHSAPSIYGKVLEALELRPGLSFLNLGSGTGYFSALVAQLIGPHAVNIGLERHEELVTHAKVKCQGLGLGDIQFNCGNCFCIDVAKCMRFDRVYIGAGAPKDARFLFKLLKYDGIIVAPFDDETGSQSLKKARCRGNKLHAVSELLPVQFTELVKPGTDEPRIIFQGPSWDTSKHSFFPASYLRVVVLLYWMNGIDGALPNTIPWQIWMKYIIPMLPFDAFEPKEHLLQIPMLPLIPMVPFAAM